jgi:hypothetical protein
VRFFNLRALLAICIMACSVSASGDPLEKFSPLWGSYISDGIEAGYSATMELGSHVLGAGLNSGFNFSKAVQAGDRSLGFIETGALLEFKHCESYLGIPGSSDAATVGLSLTYGLGPENQFPSNLFNHAGPARHNFSYRYTWYISTDGTSQTTGRIAYELVGDRNKLKIQMDNDLFNWPSRDEWRTAAAEIEFLHALRSSVAGVSLGFMLWTGTTEGLLPVPGTNSLDLSGQHGGQYSNGIAFVSLIWGIARLSIGYDSEAIRDVLQNTAHRIGGWYEIPRLDRPDKWYIQVSLGSMDSLY